MTHGLDRPLKEATTLMETTTTPASWNDLPISTPDERRQRGLQLYRDIMAVDPPEPATPREAALIDFVFAEIWPRPVLNRRERRLIAMTCAAGADAASTVAGLFYGALKTGEFTAAELDEFVLHFSIYCGWPKGEVVDSILAETCRRIAGEDGRTLPPRPAQPLSSAPADQELRKQGGEQEFRDVNCIPAPPRGIPYYEFGILHYVFGEMWKRPGLSRRDRRLITLASVGLDDTIGPIQSHVNSAMKSGDVNLEEMRELVLQFAAYSGWPKAQFLTQAIEEAHVRITTEADGAGAR